MTRTSFNDIIRGAGFCKSPSVDVPVEGVWAMFNAGVKEFN